MTFTIVIPLYNKASVVSATLQSVLSQTYTDYEVIIVDDGSTDNSLQVLSLVKDPRIKVFSKPNGGVSSARNYGIKKAKGEYIAFLDADDLWQPGFLSEMKRLMDTYPGCGIYSSGYICRRKEGDELRYYGREGVIDNYFEEFYIAKEPYCNASCVVIPAKVFSDVGYFMENMIAGEDIFMWIAIAKKYDVCVTPEALTIYQLDNSENQFRSTKRLAISCDEFIKLYEPGNFYLNEVLAYWGIKGAIGQALINNKEYSLHSEKIYNYTKCFRRKYNFLCLLNRLPYIGVCLVKKAWRIGSVIKNKLLLWIKK